MQSVLSGSALAVAIAVVAWVVLTGMDRSTGEKYSTENVRLGAPAHN